MKPIWPDTDGRCIERFIRGLVTRNATTPSFTDAFYPASSGLSCSAIVGNCWISKRSKHGCTSELHNGLFT